MQDFVNNHLKLFSQTLGQGRLKFNEPLSRHVFSKIGGPAEAFYIATEQKELVGILNNADLLKIPYLVIGSGTKILIPSRGVKGLVIKNRSGNIKVGGIKGKVSKTGIGIEEALVEVDSGVTLGKLNDFLESQRLKRIDSLTSLKSTIGGSIFLDPHLRNITHQIKVWKEGELMDLKIEDLQRESIVLSVILKVKALA